MKVEQMFTAEDVAARWRCKMVIVEQCNYGFIDKIIFFNHDAREVKRSDFANNPECVAIFKVKKKYANRLVIDDFGQLTYVPPCYVPTI